MSAGECRLFSPVTDTSWYAWQVAVTEIKKGSWNLPLACSDIWLILSPWIFRSASHHSSPYSWLFMTLSQSVTVTNSRHTTEVFAANDLMGSVHPSARGALTFSDFSLSFCSKERKTPDIVTSFGKIVVMVNYGAAHKKWAISKTTLTFRWTL